MKNKEIDKLVEANLISNEQALDIKKYYSKKTDRFNMSMILPMLGVFLIAGGIISISAYNWNNIPQLIRLLVGITPLCILSFVFYKKHEHSVFKECISFAMGLSVLLALGVTFQIIQTDISFHSILRIGVFCMLPIIYVFDTYWLASICAFILVLSGFYDAIFFTPLALIPYYIKKVKQYDKPKALTLIFTWAIIMSPLVVFDEESLVYATLLVLNLLYLVVKDYQIGKDIIGFVNTVSILIFGFFSFDLMLSTHIIYAIICALIFILIYIFAKNKTLDHDEFYMFYFANFMYCLQSIRELIPDLLNAFIGLLLPLIVAGLLFLKAYINFKERDIKKYNNSIFLFASFIIIKMFSLQMALIGKGLLLLIIGIGFFVLNRYIMNLLKNDEVGELNDK